MSRAKLSLPRILLSSSITGLKFIVQDGNICLPGQKMEGTDAKEEVQDPQGLSHVNRAVYTWVALSRSHGSHMAKLSCK